VSGAIPISVLFTDAHSLAEAIANVPEGHGSAFANYPHRFRVVVGAGGRVLKDNTGFCRDDAGRFKPPG
jgi:hypothetical protein